LTITYIQLLGIIPVLLILWIGNQLHRSIPEDQGMALWFRFLLLTLTVLLTFLILLISLENQSASFLWILLTPVSSGVFALIAIHLFSDSTIWSGSKLTTAILLLIPIALLVSLGIFGDISAPLLIALSGTFIALIWWSWNRIGEKYLRLGVIQVVLLGVSLWAADANYQIFESPTWLATSVHILIFFMPACSIALAAHLVFDLVCGDLTKQISKILIGVILILSTIFILGWQMFLTSVWDVATDGLGAPLLEMLVAITSIAAAMIMFWFLPGWRRLATLAFAVLVPLSLQYPNWAGTWGPDGEWGMSPAIVTEQRADKIANAIQRHYEDYGEYPASLKELFPRNLIYIPRPIMIPGQTWCYEGGKNYYRLGYVHRQYFSSPASVRIHISSGEPPYEYWPCEDEAVKYPGFLGNQGP